MAFFVCEQDVVLGMAKLKKGDAFVADFSNLYIKALVDNGLIKEWSKNGNKMIPINHEPYLTSNQVGLFYCEC